MLQGVSARRRTYGPSISAADTAAYSFNSFNAPLGLRTDSFMKALPLAIGVKDFSRNAHN